MPTDQLAPGTQRTVFLNRRGGTYQIGTTTDSAANTVKNDVVGPNATTTATIPPLASYWNWPALVACVKQHYAGYNLSFVESEPTSGIYVEAVVGGTGEELGWGPLELFGIAAADNFCTVTERGIAFNFSETHRDVARRADELCATVAHEIGHLLALEHEGLAQDAMSYVLIADSGTKAFVDELSTCGPYPTDPMACACNPGGMTNSVARLRQFVGNRPTETVPPTLAIEAPVGGELSPVFEVVATATDDQAMSDVVAIIGGTELGSDTEAEANVYRIPIRDAPEGEHTLTVIARDEAGNEAVQEVAITVVKQATGQTCTANEACTGGICATGEDGMFCTESCTADDTCPDDFACEPLAGSKVCVPSGGCGCTAGDPAGVLLGLAALALTVRRRRSA